MKKNFIPRFIEKQYLNKRYKGKFQAVTLFMDIVGFTLITETLMNYGKEGAEVLSEIINKTFDSAINSIYSKNGWILSFAGDAFTAVFTGKKVLNSIISAIEIRDYFKDLKIETRFGEFKFNVRIGLSYGLVKWRIIPGPKQSLYYFFGDGLDQCSDSEHHCKPGEIIIDKNLKKLIRTGIKTKGKKQGFFSVTDIIQKLSKTSVLKRKDISRLVLKKFIPSSVLNLKQIGEFRNIVSVFISFTLGKDQFQFDNTIIDLISFELQQYGGYLNKIDFGDKGGVILSAFGAPLGCELAKKRALEFALSIKGKLTGGSKARFGIASGVVYSGIIGSKARAEYTIMGEVVNLTARFMMKAKWGDIYFDEEIFQDIKNDFKINYIGKQKFKGFKKGIKVYQVIKANIDIKQSFTGELIGRQIELKKLIKYLKPIRANKFGGLLYIDGHAGIGKSRLLDGFKKSLPTSEFNWFYMPCNGILKHSFNPFIYFLRNYFKQDDGNSSNANRKNFEKKFRNLTQSIKTKALKAELLRNKSFIAALLNIFWKDSIYSHLDAKAKYENTLFSVKDFIKAINKNKPVIIHLEDAHHLDYDSLQLLKILTRNVENIPLLIIADCRLNDDGSYFDLGFKAIKQNRILIKELDKKSSKEMLESWFGGKVSFKLFNLIWEKSDGNPFIIEQIILYLKEHEALILKKGVYFIDAQEFQIPDKVSSIIITRVDHLESRLKELVKTSSVLGKEFSVKVLTAMLKWKHIKKYLNSVEKESIWMVLTEIIYIFKHAIIRDTIYEMQLKKVLRSLHKLAGNTIETLYKNDLKNHYEKLAYHFEKAEVKLKALKYLEHAGDSASASYKNNYSIDFYRRFLNIAKKEKDIIRINLKIGKILELIGEWGEAEEIYKTNLKLSSEMKDKRYIALNELKLGSLLMDRGELTEAINFLEKSEMKYMELGDKQGLSSVLVTLGVFYKNKGKSDLAMYYYNKYLELSKEQKSNLNISIAFGNIGVVYDNLGDFPNAMKFYKKQIKLCEKIKNKQGIRSAVCNIGIIHGRKGKFNKAMKYFKKQLEICKELGDRRGISIALGNIGAVLWRETDYKGAFQYFKRKLEISKELGDKRGLSFALVNIGVCYSRKGDYKNAMKYYGKQLEICEELGDKRSFAFTKGNMGNIYKNIGDLKNSIKCYQKEKQIYEELGDKYSLSNTLARIANYYIDDNNFKVALKYLNDSIKLARELKSISSLSEFLDSKANLLFETGKIRESIKINDEVLELLKKTTRPDIEFSAAVLKNKHLSLKDKPGAVKKLKMMDVENLDDDNQATLYYEIYRLTGNKKDKIKSINLYKKLYQHNPNIKFKMRIKELEN